MISMSGVTREEAKRRPTALFEHLDQDAQALGGYEHLELSNPDTRSGIRIVNTPKDIAKLTVSSEVRHIAPMKSAASRRISRE